MTHEAYCAFQLGFLEAERFMAVGDGELARILNPYLDRDLSAGAEPSLPDLLSVKEEAGRTAFRLREVKFKLERRLIIKALTQLESGLRRLFDTFPDSVVDRVEVALALRQRKIKSPEKEFLGESLGPNRYRLRLGARQCEVRIGLSVFPVSVVAL